MVELTAVLQKTKNKLYSCENKPELWVHFNIIISSKGKCSDWGYVWFVCYNPVYF